jgi:hypothetical protein
MWNTNQHAEAAIDALVAKYNLTGLTNEFNYFLEFYRDSAFSCVVYVLVQNYNYSNVQLFDIVVKDGANKANFSNYILNIGRKFSKRVRQGRSLTTLQYQNLPSTDP